MAFKFQDLMVEIGCGGDPDVKGSRINCCNSANSAPPWILASSPAQLQELKASLRQALAHIEEREKSLTAPDKPQTLDAVSELETKLEGALRELREHKKSLTA